jgi:hypothetical protein
MKSIVTTYPDYQSLPKGIKMMLVASESLFFEDAKSAPARRADEKQKGGVVLPVGNERFREQPLQVLPPFWNN